MLWLCVFLCYLCLLELVLFKFSKKHKRLLAIAFVISAVLALLSLTIWGLLRNF